MYAYDSRSRDHQSNPSAATEALGPDASTERIAQRAELETLGLSRSIINLIESHFYTPEQVEIVKTQKETLKCTIASLNLDQGTSKTSTPNPTPTPNKVSEIDWLRSELARVRGALDHGDYAEEPERGSSIKTLKPTPETLTKRNCSHSSATYTDREAPPPRTRDTTCGVDGEEFDMFLFQKKYSHILNMKKEQQQDAHDTQTAENDFGGEEVELDGGVALTEESVENHTPDIITEDTMTQI
ncbi:hypothetical protein B0A49_07500 [Cryomyces minteri]|uniref:Uncharacterized protein n=1 Tax=Cryomyces minteri TaxID=331657 RepID=A0A4U0X3Y1_9PEZI|nr:hypothetical protein B0A49_07500 [Cryomyces minteri]